MGTLKRLKASSRMRRESTKTSRQEKKGNYAKDAKKFYEWYKEVVEDMPIVSSYALANPLTGNYHGFLSVLSKTGRTVTDRQLKQNHDALNTLQNKAREFMKQHSVKLVSDNRLVMFAIDSAYGRDFDAERFDGMFMELM